MKLGDIMDIAASGLAAQRVRMATSASNLANAETTRTEGGGPYRRRDPVFRSQRMAGTFDRQLDKAVRSVEVPRIATDDREPVLRFDPGHPDANDQGFVAFPNVNVVEEMANTMSASRAYEANLAIIRKVSAMAQAALRIAR